jgi:hypothetical protein
MTSDLPASSSTRQPSRRLYWGLAILIVPLAVFGAINARNLDTDYEYDDRFEQSDEVAEMFGGASIIETIQNPDRVTAQRLQWKGREAIADPVWAFEPDYEPLAEPVEVSNADWRRLTILLTSRRSYEWENDDSKSCEPEYGVRLAFERGDRHVEVWLCFECDIFVVYEQGRRIAYEDFDLIHNALAEVMQSLFPDDEAIQTL